MKKAEFVMSSIMLGVVAFTGATVYVWAKEMLKEMEAAKQSKNQNSRGSHSHR